MSAVVACGGSGDDGSQGASDAVVDGKAPWTTEEQVKSPAEYARVLDHFKNHVRQSRFTSEHAKRAGAHPGEPVQIAYAIARAEVERGAIVVVNGRTESFSHYPELIYDLNRRGYTLYLIDHRGQGHSSRLLDYGAVGDDEYQKGYVDDFQDYVDDLGKFVDTVVTPDRKGKAHGLFALAHSMGGAITTLYAEQNPGKFDGLAFSSPMHQIQTTTLQVILANVADFFVPEAYAIGHGPRTLDEPYLHNELTNSEPRFDAKMAVFDGDRSTDVGGPTYQWVVQSVAATKTLQREAGKIQVPVLLLEAGSDQIVAPEGHRAVCDAINAAGGNLCNLVVMPGAQHEVLIEVDAVRRRALDLVVAFVAEHTPQPR